MVLYLRTIIAQAQRDDAEAGMTRKFTRSYHILFIHSFIHSFILNQATWPIDSSNTIQSETD